MAEANHCIEEDLKSLQQEKESHAKHQRVHDGQVVGLKERVYESLHQILKNVYGALNQAK